MLTWTVVILLGQAVAPPASPAGMLDTVLSDLMDPSSVPAVRRPFMRYLTTYAIPDDQQDEFEFVLSFVCNSLSARRQVVAPVKIADYLYRIDLSDYGWDQASRTERHDLARKNGVDFGIDPGKQTRELRELLNPWEKAARIEPYFRPTIKKDDGTLERGWTNPISWDQLSRETQSANCIIRADWFVHKVSYDDPIGLYSDFLMLPKDEANLYKMFGVNTQFVFDSSLLQGGAVTFSSVAQHNRALELLPSFFGRDDKFVWRTYDFASSVDTSSILRKFAGVGELKHDAREMIGTLPNGAHWYYLANGAGERQAEAPIKIAQDKVDPHDAIVYTFWKCVSCHGPNGGINPFKDVINDLALSPKVGLAVLAKNINDESARRRLEDYYLTDLDALFHRQQESYRRFLEDIYYPTPQAKKNYETLVASKDVEDVAVRNSRALVNAMHWYEWTPIKRNQAAREMGYTPEQIDSIFIRGDRAELLALLADRSVTRDQFESVFGAGMQGGIYPWEGELNAPPASKTFPQEQPTPPVPEKPAAAPAGKSGKK